MRKTGIQITEDGDLAITACNLPPQKKTLLVGNTLYQNQYMILKAQKGDFKEYPLLGVGIDDITNDEDTTIWKRRIREGLLADELQIETLSISNGQILIDADYE